MVEQNRIDDLRAAGADDFMNKPFAVEDLIRRCCEMLEMEDQEAAAG
jgi:DNA-binding response OmpR family regulator